MLAWSVHCSPTNVDIDLLPISRNILGRNTLRPIDCIKFTIWLILLYVVHIDTFHEGNLSFGDTNWRETFAPVTFLHGNKKAFKQSIARRRWSTQTRNPPHSRCHQKSKSVNPDVLQFFLKWKSLDRNILFKDKHKRVSKNNSLKNRPIAVADQGFSWGGR